MLLYIPLRHARQHAYNNTNTDRPLSHLISPHSHIQIQTTTLNVISCHVFHINTKVNGVNHRMRI